MKIDFVVIRFVLSAKFALKKMEDVTTCSVMAANTIFAGCVWVIGRLTDQNIIVVHATRRIPM
jgi:hypothetical protein